MCRAKIKWSCSVTNSGKSATSSSKEAIGTVIELNGSPYDVVGVLPSDFEFLVPNTDLYVPIAIDRERAKRHQRDLLVVGRLNDGVSDESAQAEMSTLMAALEDEFPRGQSRLRP